MKEGKRQKKRWGGDTTLLVLLGLFALMLGLLFFPWGNAPVFYPDSATYIIPAKAIGSFNWPDFSMRTPTYPLFLVITSLKNQSYLLSTYAQVTLGALSIVLLFLIIKKLIKKDLPTFIITFLLSFDLAIIAFQGIILTETLTVFLLLLSLFLHISFLKSLNLKRFLWLILVDLLLIFLRPTFILLPSLLWTIAFLYKYFFEKEGWLKLKNYFVFVLSAILINLLAIFGYFLLNLYQSNYFGFSTISGLNTFSKMVDYGFIQRTGYQNSPPILGRIDYLSKKDANLRDPFNLYYKLKAEGYTNEDIGALNKYLISQNRKTYYKSSLKLIPGTFTLKGAVFLYSNPSNSFARHLTNPLLKIFVFLDKFNPFSFIICLFVALYFLIKKKKRFIVLFFILATVAYTILVIAETACCELPRMRIPIEYLMYFFTFYLIYLLIAFIYKFFRRKRFETV